MADQRAVGVDHALGCAGGARGVDDDHAIRRGHLGLRGDRGRRRRRPPPSPPATPPSTPDGRAGSSVAKPDLAQRRHRRRPATAARRTGRARRWPAAQGGGIVVRAIRGRAQEDFDVGGAQQVAQLGRRREGAERNASPRRCGRRPATTRRSRPPFGCSSPTWVPLPAPVASRARASSADRASASS